MGEGDPALDRGQAVNPQPAGDIDGGVGSARVPGHLLDPLRRTALVHPDHHVGEMIAIAVDRNDRRVLTGDDHGNHIARFDACGHARSGQRRVARGDRRGPDLCRVLLGGSGFREQRRDLGLPRADDASVDADDGSLGSAGAEINGEHVRSGHGTLCEHRTNRADSASFRLARWSLGSCSQERQLVTFGVLA